MVTCTPRYHMPQSKMSCLFFIYYRLCSDWNWKEIKSEESALRSRQFKNTYFSHILLACGCSCNPDVPQNQSRRFHAETLVGRKKLNTTSYPFQQGLHARQTRPHLTSFYHTLKCHRALLSAYVSPSEPFGTCSFINTSNHDTTWGLLRRVTWPNNRPISCLVQFTGPHFEVHCTARTCPTRVLTDPLSSPGEASLWRLHSFLQLLLQIPGIFTLPTTTSSLTTRPELPRLSNQSLAFGSHDNETTADRLDELLYKVLWVRVPLLP